jgi:ArsR family transcriptional regulator
MFYLVKVSNYGMSMEEILDMLGNETRREILQLLSERPCYVSELSQVLNIGQKAIIEHLELMREAGILEPRFKKIVKGRPRKYYEIKRDVILEIKIAPDFFTVETLLPKINEEILHTLPKLKRITERLEDIYELEGEEKIRELEQVYEELHSERKNIVEARKIVEYLMSQIKNEIKNEMIEEEMKEFLF